MKSLVLACALALIACASAEAQDVLVPAPGVAYFGPAMPVTAYYGAGVPAYVAAPLPVTSYYAPVTAYAPVVSYYAAPVVVRQRIVMPRRVYRQAYMYW